MLKSNNKHQKSAPIAVHNGHTVSRLGTNNRRLGGSAIKAISAEVHRQINLFSRTKKVIVCLFRFFSHDCWGNSCFSGAWRLLWVFKLIIYSNCNLFAETDKCSFWNIWNKSAPTFKRKRPNFGPQRGTFVLPKKWLKIRFLKHFVKASANLIETGIGARILQGNFMCFKISFPLLFKL
jgi:hypothetical protein